MQHVSMVKLKYLKITLPDLNQTLSFLENVKSIQMIALNLKLGSEF